MIFVPKGCLRERTPAARPERTAVAILHQQREHARAPASFLVPCCRREGRVVDVVHLNHVRRIQILPDVVLVQRGVPCLLVRPQHQQVLREHKSGVNLRLT